jgi:hypothetical protein
LVVPKLDVELVAATTPNDTAPATRMPSTQTRMDLFMLSLP